MEFLLQCGSPEPDCSRNSAHFGTTPTQEKAFWYEILRVLVQPLKTPAAQWVSTPVGTFVSKLTVAEYENPRNNGSSLGEHDQLVRQHFKKIG